MDEAADEFRCKRSDGRGWRCKMPVAEGRKHCEAHYQQGIRRQKRQPVPDHLKFERGGCIPKLEEDSDDGLTDVPVRIDKRMRDETSDNLPVKRTKKEAVVSDQVDGGNPVVREGGSPAIRIGDSSTSSVTKGPVSLKKRGRKPKAAVESSSSIKENAKSSSRKKIVKKCHWCRLTSYRVLVKCSTCKERFFCQECINLRFHCKTTIMRECPVCQGECSCQACKRGKPKKVKPKDSVIYDLEEDVVICSPAKEIVVNPKKKFDLSQQIHMIQKLLPVMEKINQEKIIELDTEAANKGRDPALLKVQVASYSEKKECSFCNACIEDAHRSCDNCSYIFCLICCQEFRDGLINFDLENLKNTKRVRSKKSTNTSWSICLDSSIRCPPKNLGGCDENLLKLTSFFPFNLTKDLEENAKSIIQGYNCKKPTSESSSSSDCLMCDGNVSDKTVFYFSTKQEFFDKNLEHFMNHWGHGQPIVIKNVFQNVQNSNWDFGFLLCEYLEKSAEYRKNTESKTRKKYSDWCEVQFGRKQIFPGGISITHENVWNEFLKFKIRFNSGFLKDHLPGLYKVIMENLPIQEYVNPFTGSLNLGANQEYEAKNPNLGFYVNISYGVSENPNLDSDLLSKLCFHPNDMVNILVNATECSIPEKILKEVKILMNKYNSQSHLMSSKKVANRNKIEEMMENYSKTVATCHNGVDLNIKENRESVLLFDDSSDEESENEEFFKIINNCGARWDIFKREDVPKLIEYLKKYSDKLISRSYNSPKKVVHPLFDEIFYLNDYDKERLKKEFNVEAWSFYQDIGEAVMIPAGCPYQMKKIKSCVNVVLEFISPESALDCIKVNDEIRLLPANHKAKVKMVHVKKMAIDRMQETIEEMRET